MITKSYEVESLGILLSLTTTIIVYEPEFVANGEIVNVLDVLEYLTNVLASPNVTVVVTISPILGSLAVGNLYVTDDPIVTVFGSGLLANTGG